MKIAKGHDPSDLEVIITRQFAAPRELVFDAFTNPEIVKHWMLGPPGHTMPVCEIDLRVNGAWRYVWQLPDGSQMGAGGVFREVIRPEKTVHTEMFDEDWTGGETLVTSKFTEQDGGTNLVMTILYASTEARNAALASPMADGMEAGYQRLDSVLSEAA